MEVDFTFGEKPRQKRRHFSESDDLCVKRFASDLSASDSTLSWTKLQRAVSAEFEIGPTVFRRMLARAGQTRKRKGRPRLMTDKAVKAWEFAINFMSKQRKHVGLDDVRTIVSVTIF